MNSDKAVELLRAALLEVPGVDRMEIVTSSAVADTPIDFVCRVTVHGREHVLAGEVKSNGQPRHVQAALFQLKRYVEQQLGVVIPLLVAPYLSEDARALCVESNVGYLDLQGNARIAFPGFFLYYPSRRQQPAALSALIDALRLILNGEMSDWSIERAWKTIPASYIEQ